MEPHMAAQPNQNPLFATTDGHDSDIGNDVVLGLPSRTRNNEGSKEPRDNSITNPPFTPKGNLPLVSSGGARGDQDERGSHTTKAHIGESL